MTRFSIKRIINQVGETLTLEDITLISVSDRGDPTTSTSVKTIDGYVDEMAGDEEIVEEGLLEQGDIIVFVDEEEKNVAYLKIGNKFVRNSKNYEIKNVIHNPGHYEVHCKRK